MSNKPTTTKDIMSGLNESDFMQKAKVQNKAVPKLDMASVSRKMQIRRESEDVNNSLIQSDQDLLKQDIKGQMKMLRKGFNSQARLAMGLQHVMSAREIIPPQ